MFKDNTVKPSFKRYKVSVEDVRKKASEKPDWKNIQVFLAFLEQLDPAGYEVYYENEQGIASGREGYRVVHFVNGIEEKWHNTFYTWFGLGAWMS